MVVQGEWGIVPLLPFFIYKEVDSKPKAGAENLGFEKGGLLR
jgi:hypothetical protein